MRRPSAFRKAPPQALVNNAHQQLWRRCRIVIVASRFNQALSEALAAAAKHELQCAGIPASQIRLVWVPGAFELPVVVSRIARSRQHPDAVIAVGVLVKGKTSQYQVLANAVAQGLTTVSCQTGIPVTFGVIVAETTAQAAARARPGPRNRGVEAARATLDVLWSIEQSAVS